MSPTTAAAAALNPFHIHLRPFPDNKRTDADWESILPLPAEPLPPAGKHSHTVFRLALNDLRLAGVEGPSCTNTIENDYVSAIIVISGSICIERKTSLWRLSGGDFLITPAGAMNWRSTAFSAIFIIFSRHRINEAVRSLKLQTEDPSISTPSELLHPVICRSGEGKDVASMLRTIHLVLCIASDLHASSPSLLPHLGLDCQLATLSALLAFPALRQSAEQKPRSLPSIDHCIEQVIAYIDDHLSQPLNLTEIEAQSHYSRRALQYAFRRRFNCTVTQWIRARRLDLAHRRLSLGAAGDCVSSIARACGYRSMSLFSIEFQQRFHRKPSDLLRESRAGRSTFEAETVLRACSQHSGEPEI